MINTETIKFISRLNGLAERSKNGIYPFSTATKEQKNGLLYDDSKTFGDVHSLVADCLIDDEHHDIISTFTEMYDADDIVVGVRVEEDDAVYVSVTSRNDSELNIVIENGIWYQS